jgi:hypothetical protein
VAVQELEEAQKGEKGKAGDRKKKVCLAVFCNSKLIIATHITVLGGV